MYGHSVILARIGNSIVAENQRRLFDRLQQQNLNYFGERHSSELLSRLSAGAAAASQALNLVITAIGRDFLTLTALTVVMVVQDPDHVARGVRGGAADRSGFGQAGQAHQDRGA